MSTNPNVRSGRILFTLLVATAALGGLLVTTATGGSPATAASPALPSYDHVVLAIFENEAQSSIFGSSNAPYLTGLAHQGAHFTQSYAVEHPSQPNYLDLFSGSNQGVTNDSCPHSIGTDNLGHQLLAAGKTFVGYAENLPSAGSAACSSSDSAHLYQRKHAPWANFTNLNQSSVSKPYNSFPTDFSSLPSFSWVTPNMCNDMHDCSVSTGDTWARNHLDAYGQWAKTHNSLLIVTFDEDDRSHGNQIETAFVGAHVRAGTYTEHIDHFTVLRTLEDLFGLAPLGGAANRSAISDVWDLGPTPSEPVTSGSTYTITRVGTDQQLTDPGSSTSNSTQMVATAATSGSNQKWFATRYSDGTYLFKNLASGKCLDNAANSTTAGTKIIQWTCTGNSNQRWRLVAGSSAYNLVNVRSGLWLGRGSTHDPAPVIQFSGSNAVWVFTKVA